MILTVENLIEFCKSNKIYNFSSKESGKPIVVQSVQDFSSADIEETDDGKMYCRVRVCHTLLNRNKSYISEESMKEAMPTLKYAPLLAMIHQLDDGTWDFHAHDFHMETDEDGKEYAVYDEHQIGTFTADEPYLEYDEEMDKTYVVARVAIPTEYTRAASIIREKKGTKVSCELIVYDCSYNVKEKYLQLNNFRFNGCVCLGSEKDGTPIGEGMLGSKLMLEDFSEENNSLVKFSNQLIEMQARLNELEARINIQDTTKGGNTLEKIKENFEEVEDAEKKDTPAEDEIIEETSDVENEEEVEIKEDNACGGGAKKKKKCEVEDNEEEPEQDEPEIKEDNACGGGSGSKKKKKNNSSNTIECSYEVDGEIRKFAISLQERIYALQSLVNEMYADADNTYYGVNVYDSYVIMQDWCSGRYYKQSYTSENDNYSLVGDRVEVYAEFVTADEQKELESMRSNYSTIIEQLNAYKYAEDIADKLTIFEDESYSAYLETEAFKTLMSEDTLKEFTKEELIEKADAALGKAVKESKTFSFNFSNEDSSGKKKNKIGVFSDFESAENQSIYGDYFKSVN